jgi:DNA-binding response OmpR family regulator
MKKDTLEKSTSEILIVDDIPANVQMVSSLLKTKGYKVRVALGGKLALQAVRDNPPDLILLDINMPEMDGYEVCERLKHDDKSKGIPVIFISSLSETIDKVKAFQFGCVDYVEKPFRIEEVFARIETHLKIRNLQRELSRHNQHLEELVRERTSQLAEAHRRLAIMDRTKSEFLNLISHELRTPLNGIFGVAELLFQIDEMNPEQKELWDIYNTSRNSMMKILDDALLLTHIEVSGDSFTSQITSLDSILGSAIAFVKSHPQPRPVAILPEITPPDVNVHGDSELLVKAFSYLLETATRFSSGEPVTIACTRTSSAVKVVICAKGRIIPEDMLADFFDVFSVSRPIRDVGDLGLGPPVAKRIISLFGGSVAVRNEDPAGVSFTVTCRKSM